MKHQGAKLGSVTAVAIAVVLLYSGIAGASPGPTYQAYPYKATGHFDLTGVQAYRVDATANVSNGTGCGTAFNWVPAHAVVQDLIVVTSSTYDEFGTAHQCSGSEYWYVYDIDSTGTSHMLRSQGITGHDWHHFYLWQNTSTGVWDAQIDSTNWKTFTNSASEEAGNVGAGAGSYDSDSTEFIAFEQENLNYIENNQPNPPWTSWDTDTKVNTGSPMCLYEIDQPDWNVAENPSNTSNCTGS
jgi:hypothetical protein